MRGRNTRVLSPLCTQERFCEDTVKRWPSTSQVEDSTGNQLYQHPYLERSASRTVRKCLVLKPSKLWHFVMVARADYDKPPNPIFI
jgi:hypothetical protein